MTLYGGGNSISGVTYGGVSMTQEVYIPNASVPPNFDNANNDYLFGLASPPSGAQTIVVTTNASNQYVICGAITVVGSSTTTCFRSTTNSLASSTTLASITVATLAGDLVADMLQSFGGANMVQGGSLAWGPIQDSALLAGGSYKSATGTSTTLSWSYSGTADSTDQVLGVFQVGLTGPPSFKRLDTRLRR